MTRIGGKFLENDYIQETTTGTVNGTNTSFTLANSPSAAGIVDLYLDGLRLTLTTDYTISGTTITMVTAPVLGQKLTAAYLKGN